MIKIEALAWSSDERNLGVFHAINTTDKRLVHV